MKKFVFAFCVPLILLGFSCTRDFSVLQLPSRERDPQPEPQHIEKELLNASSDFGIGLFKEVAKAEAGKNVFISPFSVSAALGMTLNGAAGQTETDMRKTLGFPGWTQVSINEAYRSLINALTQADPKVAMDIAQAIYYALGFAVEPSFIQTNLAYFDALVSELDFSLPSAPDTINGWIEENTGGKIRDMIKKIERDDVMFLVNAIYFKGTWTIQFDEKETRNETFTLGDGSRVTCPMMRMCDSLSYLSTADFQAVEMAYGDGAFSMVVFLPKNGQTANAFIQGITPEKWNDWMGRLEVTKVNLILPKFKAEY
ncbi:MAG TPA: serpin family protein, partial [bacterium]